MATSTTTRLVSLRRLMQDRGLTAYIVPSEDEHSSEYLSPYDELRPYISGFTGSAGTAVVELDKAHLFTDGRYYLQARSEMDDNWTLMKLGLPDTPTHLQYLSSSKPSRVGVPSHLIPLADFNSLRSQGVNVEGTDDLVGMVWNEEGGRGKRLEGPIKVLGLEFCGQTVSSKLTSLRSSLIASNHQGMILTTLDEIAWLFNLRGFDIEFNPVFFSYALVTPSASLLFLPHGHAENLSPEVRHHLVKEGVSVKPYEDVWGTLGELRKGLLGEGKQKILGGLRTSLKVAECLGVTNLDLARSPVTDAKAIKNLVELEGFRQCHVRDGVALVKYFAWLEEVLEGGGVINEFKAATKLEEFRKENALFQGLSFETISSTGANAAIIHYSPSSTNSAIIRKDQIYLCDSGAQYLDGTTDVTRTLHFGTPSAQEIRAFTRVLQGHIAIETAVFPCGTTGYLLDAFARRPLWEDGLDYRHGTSHGVGHFLNVHEGPQGIGTRKNYDESPLKEGMVMSNEPGYYEDGKFGIRIESIVLVTKALTRNNFGGKGFLTFENVTRETLSLTSHAFQDHHRQRRRALVRATTDSETRPFPPSVCPLQLSLIDSSLLTVAERTWVNSYHRKVKEMLGPLLGEGGRARSWLDRSCVEL
ncbi:Creatinase/aminopeptidase [Mrakia frigida]|uniref:aminopeptidase P family protein n=1 Tax=Mrakia frigida TaxID=29902 RepID=UPI003FCC18B7